MHKSINIGNRDMRFTGDASALLGLIAGDVRQRAIRYAAEHAKEHGKCQVDKESMNVGFALAFKECMPDLVDKLNEIPAHR